MSEHLHTGRGVLQSRGIAETGTVRGFQLGASLLLLFLLDSGGGMGKESEQGGITLFLKIEEGVLSEQAVGVTGAFEYSLFRTDTNILITSEKSPEPFDLRKTWPLQDRKT